MVERIVREYWIKSEYQKQVIILFERVYPHLYRREEPNNYLRTMLEIEPDTTVKPDDFSPTQRVDSTSIHVRVIDFWQTRTAYESFCKRSPLRIKMFEGLLERMIAQVPQTSQN